MMENFFCWYVKLTPLMVCTVRTSCLDFFKRSLKNYLHCCWFKLCDKIIFSQLISKFILYSYLIWISNSLLQSRTVLNSLGYLARVGVCSSFTIGPNTYLVQYLWYFTVFRPDFITTHKWQSMSALNTIYCIIKLYNYIPFHLNNWTRWILCVFSFSFFRLESCHSTLPVSRHKGRLL